MGWLWLMAGAWADPVALRAPVERPAATVGFHDLSLAAPLPGTRLDVAAAMATNAASAEAGVGRRWTLAGAGSRQLQTGLGGGVLVPLISPGVAVTAVPWMHGGWVGDVGTFVAGAAAPVAVGTGGARLPLLLELQGGLWAGPVLVQGRLAAGPVWTPGLDVATFLEPSLVVQVGR